MLVNIVLYLYIYLYVYYLYLSNYLSMKLIFLLFYLILSWLFGKSSLLSASKIENPSLIKTSAYK